MYYVIGEKCHCGPQKPCIAACPLKCIYLFENSADQSSQLVIHSGECLECGACQVVCPQQAIHLEATPASVYSSFGQACLAF